MKATHKARPRLAVFPKAFIDDLCITGHMTLRQWIEMAATLQIDGLEFYAGFLELASMPQWREARHMAQEHGLSVPMLCCSSDFTHPDAEFRARQVELEKRYIDMAAELGAGFCRVLSGQRRPEISTAQGIELTVACIQACLPHAEARGVTLVMENHYKDNYWQFPEFAQRMEVFCAIVERIDSPYFGVNYDPSNTLIAGEDALELLRRVKGRVKTMHASDRYLAEGTVEDLRREENAAGYARRLRHGVIGEGLNDYDAIFAILAAEGFASWISIEDGVDGFEQLVHSTAFLRKKIARHWPA